MCEDMHPIPIMQVFSLYYIEVFVLYFLFPYLCSTLLYHFMLRHTMTTETALIVPTVTALDAAPANVPTNERLYSMFLDGRKPATARKYAYDLRNFNEWLSGRSVLAVTLPDLQAYVSELLASGLSARTVRERVVVVKNLYTFLSRAGVLQLNPAAVLRLPDVRDTLVTERALSKPDVESITANAAEGRDRALLLYLFASGCRVSEVVALNCGNVEVKEGYVHVRIYRRKTNDHTAQRHPLTSAVAVALLGLVEGQPAEAPVFRSTGVPPSIRSRAGSNAGGRLDTSAVWRIVRSAAKRTGIDKPVSPHWFRHACATQLATKHQEGRILEVAAYMGHKSVNTTQRYFHALEALDMSAALSA